MNKKLTFLLLMTGVSSYFSQQNYEGRVGINTQSPNATLEVKGVPNDNNITDGIIAPRVTKEELLSKSYNESHKGTFLYVYDTKPKRRATPDGVIIPPPNDIFTKDGYYYWDGNQWHIFGDSPLTKIYPTDIEIAYVSDYRKSNPEFYDDIIGVGAFDFSFSNRSDEKYGASGGYSVAFGENNYAGGSNSFTAGLGNKSLGFCTFSFGQGNTVGQRNGKIFVSNSGALGYNNLVEGGGSFAFGINNKIKYGVTIVGGANNKANGYDNNVIGIGLIANSAYEIARGAYNSSPQPFDYKGLDKRDLIETVGGGFNDSNRLNLFERYKSGAFKYNAQRLNSTNIPNAKKGFHAADENGKLNYHNGSEWETYVTVRFAPSQPASPKKGDLYFNTTENKYYAYNGSSWISLW